MDRDGFVEITISADEMAAYASFFPAFGNGRPLTYDYVERTVEDRGIVEGVDRELLAETVFAVITDHRAREGVRIAHGRDPEPTVPGHYEVVVQHRDPLAELETEDRIDHRRVVRLPVVHAGERLAVWVPERLGQAGITVRGGEIPPPVSSVPQIKPGRNTREEEGTVFAEIGGQFRTRDGVFSVEDRLEVTGVVGYETGSIEFPGDVVLKGEVKDGFHVWAGRNISATVPVDVSEVYCRGEFTSTAGLIGRGRALLRAGGKVQVRFIGNCAVESKSTIFVAQYIYQSHVACLGRLAMADKGTIIGGVVTAAEGVRCSTIGNEAFATTTVRAGVDFIVERRLRLVREKVTEVAGRLHRMLHHHDEDPSDRRLEIINRLEQLRDELVGQMGELTERLDSHESAEIIVDGTVFPGTQISICRATHVVEERLNAVRFRLDKEAGRITIAPLKEP